MLSYKRHKFIILGLVAFIHLVTALEVVALHEQVPKVVNYIIIPSTCLVPVLYKLATCLGLGDSQSVALAAFALIITLSTAFWIALVHQILSRLDK